MFTSSFDEYISQLDLAGKQLRETDPHYGRFAIILIDNAVELMLHRRCQYEILHRNQPWSPEATTKYTESQKKAALGQHFKAKAIMCRKIEWLTADEADFIIVCHQYRSELYHLGLRHNPVLRALGAVYHEVACCLVAKLNTNVTRWEYRDVAGPEIVKYRARQGQFGTDQLVALADELRGQRPQVEALSTTLSEFALARIERMTEGLAFIESNSNGGLDEQGVFEWIQHPNPAMISLLVSPHEVSCEDLERAESAQNIFAPAVKYSSLARWTKRAVELSKERNQIRALKRFQTLQVEFELMEAKISEVACSLDLYITYLIDVARGK